jgi:hypothetical protein
VDLKSVGDVVNLLGTTINQVRKGILDVKAANAVGYLGSVLLRAIEGDELARQIEAQAKAMVDLRNEVEVMRRERRHTQASVAGHANGTGLSPDGRGGQPALGGNRGGRGDDFETSGDDAGPLADDVAPFFQ